MVLEYLVFSAICAIMFAEQTGKQNLSEKIQPRKGVRKVYLPREEGQGLVEYALILVLVAIVVIAILLLLGPQIANVFSRITSGISTT
jgi:pilus assembly protein Flp/PilA